MTRKIDPNTITNIIVMGKSGAGKQPRIDVLVNEFGLEQLSTGNIFRRYIGDFDGIAFDGDLEQFWKDGWFIPDEEIKEMLDVRDSDDSIILGLKAKYFVERGMFVPDRITNELFASAFGKKNYKNQVLDGYPRTKNQAEFLLDLVKNNNSKIDLLMLVDTADELIIKRTVKRRICPKCGKVYHLDYNPPNGKYCKKCGSKVIQRSDDTEEKIRSRLEEFRNKSLPALNFLQSNGIPIAKVPGHLDEFTPENVRKSVMEEIEKYY